MVVRQLSTESHIINMETTNQIPKNRVSEKQHEHRWTVITSHWQCEICGRTFG